jgi:amino acid transporter
MTRTTEFRLLGSILLRPDRAPSYFEIILRILSGSRYADSRIYMACGSRYLPSGLPDRQMLTRISKRTQTPLYAVWFTTFICILPGLLDLASPIAANAIFSLCAIALDTSYIIPIFCRRWYSVRPHPEVVFKPGPFYLGNGLLGWIANTSCIVWTCFIVVIFSLPNYKPVTAQNMNYASVITGGVVILSGYVRPCLPHMDPIERAIGYGTCSVRTNTTRAHGPMWTTPATLT